MTRQQQITTTLIQFYHKPIAQVSLELMLSVGAVIFFGAFAIRPTLVTMSNLIKELEEKRELSQQLSQKIAALTTAQIEYSTLEERLTLLDEAIPSGPQLLKSLKIFEKIASENNVIITSISTPEIPGEATAAQLSAALESPTAAPPQLERHILPVSLSVTGDYLAIRQMVTDIENSRRLMSIETITFSTVEERGLRKLQATVTVGLPYFSVPGNGPGAANKPGTTTGGTAAPTSQPGQEATP